ncbi:hypothetical protein [Amycolatopsis orientalis]|uniref:hypothetical protein n=1 Tax=Amycolatopsis orientalis TaxID=31958 RepID=UPI0011AB5BB9|nr:hypothetical protein [Amycolatopsis orientalis]
MGGQAAALGFEYQFLSTLSFALRGLLDADDWLSGVVVDAPPASDLQADQEIVDFALLRGDRCELAAQVKGGTPGSTMSAADAVRVLLRLLTHEADRYALITNRRPSPGLLTLIDAVHEDGARERIAAVVSRSPEVQRAVLAAGSEWVGRLARVQFVIDDRSVDELRTAVREQVRAARRMVDPRNVGWDAAGLLTGYLVAEVLAKAASPDCPILDRAALDAALRIDPQVLRTLMRDRDWAVPLTPAPRATDIARPDVLERIGQTLSTPISGDSVPVCVLTGLSGIGKTGIATAWVEDRADAYTSIIWVEAATSAQIEASFVQAAILLAENAAGAGQSARDVVRGALARTAHPWLMVFDNASSLRGVRDWLPTSGLGHVLVTTVDPTAISGPNIASVVVGAMTEKQAVTLLAARLLNSGKANAAETDLMRGLAVRLQRWPLALELAATYLNDCLGGLAGVAAYESLLMRSLGDEDCVPHGYPHTLVRAIQIAWQRMVDRSTEADRLAVAALRFASLLAPRRIPLHILLSACLLEPRSLLEDGVERGPRVYGGQEPPLGEVVRAMRRQSLAVTDMPLGGREYSVSLDSTAFTIAVNEIVQVILLEDLRNADELDVALSMIAFHVQYWLSFYMDQENYSVATSLIAHAVAAAEHALDVNSQDYCVALLLGNTARMLEIADAHDLAADYLRAELEILPHCPGDQSLLRLQTAANLASVLYQSAERPREVSGDIAEVLEILIQQISAAYEIDQEATAHTLRVALIAVINLIHDGGGTTPRIEQLRLALEQYCEMMPLTERLDLGREVIKINALIKEGDYREALAGIDALLEVSGLRQLEKAQLFRLRLECHVWSSNWGAALRDVEPFVEAAASGTIRAGEAANVARNVAIATLQNLTNPGGPAAALLGRALTVADFFERHGGFLQAHDKVVIDLLRCVRAALEGNLDYLRRTLAQLDLDELAKLQSVTFYVLHALLYRWVELVPRWAPPAVSSAPYCAPKQARTLSAEEALGATAFAPLEWRPLMAAAVSQAWVGIDPVADGHHAAAVDLIRTLEVMGFQAEVVRTSSTLRRAQSSDEVVHRQSPHHIIYSSYFGRIVDPGLPALIESAAELPDLTQAAPSIFPIADLEQINQGAGILARGNILTVYHGVNRLNKSDVSSDSNTACKNSVMPLLIAIKAVIALTISGNTEALVRKHSTLRDLIPPDGYISALIE